MTYRGLTVAISLVLGCGGNAATVSVDAANDASTASDAAVARDFASNEVDGSDGGSTTIATVGKVKWFPTVLAQTVDVNSDPTGEADEIDVLANSFAQYPALAGKTSWKVGDPIGEEAIVGGYALWRFWRDIEPSKDTYNADSIVKTLVYLEQKIPGARLGIGVGCYANWGKAFDASAGQRAVPDYIYDGDVATYGHAPPNGNGAGWGFGSYQGKATPTYNFVFAALWNANTMARWNQAFVGLGKVVVPKMVVNGVTYEGYTINNHPLIEMLNDFTPDDFGIPNNSSPAVPTDYSATQFQTNWLGRAQTLADGLPNVSMALMPGFGFGTGADQIVKVASLDAGRMAMSTTDTKAYNTAATADLSDGLHAFIGDTFDAQTSTWTTGGGVDHRGKMPMMPTMQALDFAHDTPGYKANTKELVELILGFAYNTYHSDHFLISMASSTTYSPVHDWAGANGFIAPALQAMGGIPKANQELPASYLYPVTGLAKTSANALSWSANVGGPNITYVVYRDGAKIADKIAATSFTDASGGAGHTYTVAMENDNGVGPQSAPLSF